jgi:hypothetical protein
MELSFSARISPSKSLRRSGPITYAAEDEVQAMAERASQHMGI